MKFNICKMPVPWQARIAAKLALSRLPVAYRFWSRIGIFRHGSMDDYTYAWGVLRHHAAVLGDVDGWSGLELGPGDGVLSALLAPAAFSSGLTLIDVEDFAHRDFKRYQAQVMKFAEAHSRAEIPNYSKATDVPGMLALAKGQYLCEGLDSLRLLASESFDLIFSHAVLEHVRRADFFALMQECHRLIKVSGVMSHVIDFRDHLGGRLNNMRVPSELWERPWFAARSGFYTNRLRLSEIIAICERAGFDVNVASLAYFSAPPIKRELLAPEFATLCDEDLSVSGARLVMRRRQRWQLNAI